MTFMRFFFDQGDVALQTDASSCGLLLANIPHLPVPDDVPHVSVLSILPVYLQLDEYAHKDYLARNLSVAVAPRKKACKPSQELH